MSCNCKTIKNENDIDEIVTGVINNKPLTFFTKLKISYDFIQFYFFFVTSSIINLMINDKLEPKIPKWLINKYKGY